MKKQKLKDQDIQRNGFVEAMYKRHQNATKKMKDRRTKRQNRQSWKKEDWQ